MMESVKGAEEVLSDLPEVKQYFTGFAKTDDKDCYMECKFNGKICFGNIFTSRIDVESALNKDVATRLFQPIGLDDLGKHEMLHLLEKALIHKNKKYKTPEDKINAWNNHIEAEDIIYEAFELANSQMEGKYASWENMAAEICYNAMYKPAECLVEAMLDYYLNKEKARLFSKVVYTMVKEKLQ
jgi:hypothetical protein